MKAIRVSEYGGPEVMKYEDVPTPEPGPGEALVKVAASGVNFIDVYHRTGRYPGQLPFTLGTEAAGSASARRAFDALVLRLVRRLRAR